MQIFFSIYDTKLSDGGRKILEERRQIAQRLPGLQMFLTGNLGSGLKSWATDRQLPGAATSQVPAYGELLAFKNDVAAENAFASNVGRELRNSSSELTNQKGYSAHAQAVIPFDDRKSGEQCFVAIGGFLYETSYGSLEKAEYHYIAEHTRICARLPGCRAYLIGVVERHGDEASEFRRLAFSIYRDEQAWLQTLKSPAANDIALDERGYARIANIFFLDAEIRL